MTTKLTRPELGQLCEFSKQAKKTRKGAYRSKDVAWVSEEIQSRRAIYIGWRTVANGRLSWDFDEGPSFEASSRQEVWLFVLSPRMNPVRVFPQDVKIIDAATNR